MSFSRPIQSCHSHVDPIWLDGTYNLCVVPGNGSAALLVHHVSIPEFSLRHLNASLLAAPQRNSNVTIISQQILKDLLSSL